MKLNDSVRQFLEYIEIERGRSALTLRNYQFYLERFLMWIDSKNELSLGCHSREGGNPLIDRVDSRLRGNDKERGWDDKKREAQNGAENTRDVPPNKNVIPAEAGIQVTQKSGSQVKPGMTDNSDVIKIETTDQITQELVREYRLFLSRMRDKKGKELSHQTQNYHIIALRAYLKFLASRGITALSPEKVELMKTGDRQITFLESDEMMRLLDGIDTTRRGGLRDRALLELLFSTGLRVSELVNLNYEQLNLERGEMAILGKGKKERIVFISDEATACLNGYLLARGEDHGPLFRNPKTGRRMSVRTVERIVKKYALLAGIVKPVSPHTIRHTFATDLLINGADIRSVQSLLGHSSITTTQVYTHLTDQRLREVHNAFHSRRREQKNSDLSD